MADVLFGNYNPSGKLPITFYKNVNQLPDFLDYRMTNRTYRYFTGDALFPFGHGLSYTTFKMSKPKYKNGQVKLTLANTGSVKGSETIQVYIKRTDDTEGPIKSLRAYKRVELAPNESRSVEISLPREQFETWDTATNTMRVIPGKYEVYVGNSSASASLQKLTVKIR